MNKQELKRKIADYAMNSVNNFVECLDDSVRGSVWTSVNNSVMNSLYITVHNSTWNSVKSSVKRKR